MSMSIIVSYDLDSIELNNLVVVLSPVKITKGQYMELLADIAIQDRNKTILLATQYDKDKVIKKINNGMMHLNEHEKKFSAVNIKKITIITGLDHDRENKSLSVIKEFIIEIIKAEGGKVAHNFGFDIQTRSFDARTPMQKYAASLAMG